MSATSPIATAMPRTLSVVGEVAAKEDLLVEGAVSGTIDMPGCALTIAAGARVDARVLARDVTILGTFSGRITATEMIEVRDGAHVSGEIAAPKISLAEGADIQARVETRRVDAAVHVARYRMTRAATS